MGRGDRRSFEGDVPRIGPRAHQVVLANEAMAELTELLTYISEDSAKNAASMRASVSKRLDQLAHHPGAGHQDRSAPLVPEGATARMTTIKKVAIYYLFPLRWRGGNIVYVVSVRRGSRIPLSEPEYVRRWMDELAKLGPPRSGPQG